MLFSIKNNRYHSFCQNCKHSSVINIYCVPKKHRNLLRSLISLKLVWEMFFHVKYVMLISTNYNNIIHIQNEINASLARMTIEYRMVVFTTDHTKMLHTFTTLRNLPNQDRRYCLSPYSDLWSQKTMVEDSPWEENPDGHCTTSK